MPKLFGGSEFIDNLLNKIWMNLYQGLWDGINEIWSWMQGVRTFFFTNSQELISKTPSGWNETAFTFVKNIADNAVIPIAGCIITFVFCLQIISMVQESNQMHNIKPETMLLLMIKLIICMILCAKSFDIVCGLFDIGAKAAEQVTSSDLTSAGYGSLESILPRDNPDGYSFGSCMAMLIYLMITFLALIIEAVIGVLVYIKVNMWFMELLVYASAAPIPFATFMNKEWGQTGTNYTRKMLAMSFQGFFMLIVFGMYNALCSSVLALDTSGIGNTYLMSMVIACGCGAGLIVMLNHIGSISSSIFNAH
ncbi:MAG: hypothetical protein K2N34_09925 [Lachnospiraceae bacterium]|nr:hypothetical protein [Lachnospiraceae bacterium]